MLDYITLAFFIILILGDLIAIIQIISGNYTSFFVRYFTVVSVDPKKIKQFSKNKQQQFTSLVAIAGILNILLATTAFSLISIRGHFFVIILLVLSFSVNSKFFNYRALKLIETKS